MANQYIKGIQYLDIAGEYTGSYVKLAAIPGPNGVCKAVFSHITFGQHVTSGSSANNIINADITSSVVLEHTGSIDIEGQIYAFKLSSGQCLASYTDGFLSKHHGS